MITYHRTYGYPWRWAILAELAWRIEHLPLSYEGQPLAKIARAGYRWRHAMERRGYQKTQKGGQE